MSCARVAGPLYAIVGLVAGVLVAVASLVGAMAGQNDSGIGGAMLGLSAIFVLPVVYGVIGVVGALFSAWIYNVLAAAVGGIEVDVE